MSVLLLLNDDDFVGAREEDTPQKRKLHVEDFPTIELPFNTKER